MIELHLDSWESRKPEAIEELCKSLYVDNLVSGGATIEDAKDVKQQAVKIFEDATFTLHKLHSNKEELEDHRELMITWSC